MISGLVERTKIFLRPDPSKVLLRFFPYGNKERMLRIIARIMSLSDGEIRKELDHVLHHFEERHIDIREILLSHYKKVAPVMVTDLEPAEERRLLIGAYFTSEYALESAALFNPSVVPHPDQSKMEKGNLRFIMSLRAIGEGHISSLSFRSGIISDSYDIFLEETSEFVTVGETVLNPTYEKNCFALKLYEVGFENDFSKEILGALPDEFTFSALDSEIKNVKIRHRRHTSLFSETLRAINTLAECNYEISFSDRQRLSERVIFPYASNEQKGIEDARFVRFFDEENKKATYYATYTAYSGTTSFPQLIETDDFLHFRFITLNGSAVRNKGMALFPRKVDGKYVMLSRQDNENIFIMYSDNIHFWHEAEVIMKPSYPWGFVQLGNCGSPIETDRGWLVLTHHVGPMRRYCIGAILLDPEDPSRVIGRLKEPLMEPDDNEREGYVPNVVYTCGALLYGGKLVMPYAMSDHVTSIAMVDMERLMKKLLE